MSEASAMKASSVTQPNRFVAVRLARAYARYRLQRYSDAVDDYSECLAHTPTHAATYYNRACSLYRLGQLQDAVKDLTRAIKLDNKNLLYVESRARVLKEMGNFKEAIRDYSWLDSLRRSMTSGWELPLDSCEDMDLVDSEMLLRSNSLALPLELAPSTSTSSLLAGASPAPLQSPQPDQRRAKEWLVSFLGQGKLTRSPADLQEALQRVASWSFFRGMDNAMIEKCLHEATHRVFATDQSIVKQSATSKSFFVILDTTAPLVRTVGSSGTAKYRELKTFYQGDCVGVEPPGTTSVDGRFMTFRSCLPARPGQLERHFSGADNSSLASVSSSIVLPRMKSFRSLVSLAVTSDPGVTSSNNGTKTGFMPPEPATFSCLGDVSCLVLDVGAFYSILRSHEQALHVSRLQFLRSCRGFENLPEETLSSLAAASGSKIYDPGVDVLRSGDVVKELWLIKRGVCQVRKTITLAPASVGRKRPGASASASRWRGQSSNGGEDLTSRSVDGSWVLDNGWMLTNPRLVTGAQQLADAKKIVTEDVTVAVLASGQLFGELSVLQPGQPSPVTVRTQTMVETLVFQAEDLSELNVQYHSGTMNALQESLLFHNPPQQKIAQLHREHERWGREKAGVLDELFPSKSAEVLLKGLVTPVRTRRSAELSSRRPKNESRGEHG